MSVLRRVAAMFDPDQLSLRERGTLEGIARYADGARWQLVLDPFAVYRPAGRWDGLLVPTRRGLARPLRDCRAPVVCVAWSQKQLRLPHAAESRAEGGRVAARHFIERGYRSFAYVGFQREVQSRVERAAFCHALGFLGRRVAAARTFATFASHQRWWDKVTASVGDWLGRFERPLGLFVARPGLGRALADWAAEHGLRIPQDLGILVADDDPVVCERPPALTSLRFDYAEVGSRAAELLDRLMRGQSRPARAVLVEPALVPRLSTDREGVRDPLVADALWFIDSRRTESIRPRHVAAALGVGERRLQRHLRRAGRDTVQGEILKARVEHAKLLLADPRGTVRGVAHECGLGSYAALYRAFKRHAGMAPSAWRQSRTDRPGSQGAPPDPARAPEP